MEIRRLILIAVVAAFSFNSWSSLEDFSGKAFIIHDSSSSVGGSEYSKAKKAYRALVQSDQKWKESIIFINKYKEPKKYQEFKELFIEEGKSVPVPFFAFIEGDAIERKFQSGCGTPIDKWSLSWLAKGIDERPENEAPQDDSDKKGYPIRGNWWSVDGDWNPSKEKVVDHLLDARLHKGSFEKEWLETLNYKELQSLHTDHHRHLIGRGDIHWDYVNKIEND